VGGYSTPMQLAGIHFMLSLASYCPRSRQHQATQLHCLLAHRTSHPTRAEEKKVPGGCPPAGHEARRGQHAQRHCHHQYRLLMHVIPGRRA
jgi:hypothetical protein